MQNYISRCQKDGGAIIKGGAPSGGNTVIPQRYATYPAKNKSLSFSLKKSPHVNEA